MDIRQKFEVFEKIAIDVHKKLFAGIFHDIG